MELVRGPSSVLYGSDAIGGTVNALSKNYRYASAEDSHMGRPELSLQYLGCGTQVLKEGRRAP